MELLINKLAVEQEKKKKSELQEKWDCFVETAKNMGLSIDDALNLMRKDVGKKSTQVKRKVPIKYRDPKDPSNVWAGRGKTPNWLQEYVDQGRSKAEFRVDR